jgi:hypothetical protein
MRWANRLLRIALELLAVGILVLVGAAIDSAIRQRYPEGDIGKDSLLSRKQAQLEAAKQFKVFYQFQFADKLKESGITFTHHGLTTSPNTCG